MPPSTLIHRRHHHHLLLLLFLLSCASFTSTSTTHNHNENRRILHQPFYPHDDSLPPTPPPTPSPPTTPEYPFTSSSTPTTTPFFSTDPSPPSPPSPPSFVSFPANISSVILPQPHNSKTIPTKLIATIVAVIAAAVIVLFVAVVLHLRNRAFTDTKTSATDNDAEDNTRNGNIPKLQRPSQTSSEFLYLGTLVNSHGGLEAQRPLQNTRSSGNANNGSVINGGKMDSPELRPLPPLTGRQNYANAEVGLGRDEGSRDFYSPMGIGSESRRAFAANLNASRFSSSSHSSSSSGSGSPARSVSLSISPPVSSSPKSWRPKSPELVAVQVQMPTRPAAAGPHQSPPLRSDNDSLLASMESSPRSSDVESPAKISSAVRQATPLSGPPVPPPPPPLPSVYRGIPRMPTPPVQKPAAEQPPVLVTPLRPTAVESPTLISPMQLPSHSENVEKIEKSEETLKPKLKPLHWDKVKASSDHEMVWDQLRSSSFKLNEEMIETLFVVNTNNSHPKETNRWQVLPPPSKESGALNPKKSQNIAIFLKAIHVTVDEVCEALVEGNADTVGTEILESLLRMAPTKEEERKLKDHGDDSPIKLGPAEKFLKALLNIPFAFKRVDAMLYISNFDSEVEYLKQSFETLEAACKELRNSRMFLKLLEAALKTGNRMNVGTNRGDARAIKLDTLLKLVDVKGGDGKTTLLHFVVQEIIRSEGARLSSPNQNNDDVRCRKLGLQVVSGLSSELTNVKKVAAMDSEVLNSDVVKLSEGLEKIAEIVKLNEAMSSEDSSCHKFSQSMKKCMKVAEEEIVIIQAQESVALTLVKELTEYFHGNSAKKEVHPFRIFMVVRDFLSILDRVCKEVGIANERPTVITVHKFPVPLNPMLQPVSSQVPGKQQNSSSDDESSSSSP